MKNVEMIRALDTMPFDKMFITEEGRQINCHATGYEVCFGNPNDSGDWWNEYVDPETGATYYGR